MNLNRILKLSMPKKKHIYRNPHRPQHDRFSLYDSVSERTLKLSQPRRRTTCACENCYNSRATTSSGEGDF